MEIAKVIREDFLQQNAFSSYDYMCPLVKTVSMMKCIITYFDLAKRTIIESPVDAKITWGVIQNQTKDVLNRIQDLKQDIKPEWEKNAVMDYTSKLVGDIQESMRKLANR